MVYSREAMRSELQQIVENARHVRIVPERLEKIAALMRHELAQERPFQTDPHHFPNETLMENNLDTLQYYFVVTSQHFCIWRRTTDDQVEAWDISIDGQRYVGARGINAAHIRALRQGKNILDPNYLAAMTYRDVEDFYRDEQTGEVNLQMLPQRLAKFNELGRVLLDRYQGHVSTLLEQTNGYMFRDDGGGLVQQLTLNFPIAYFDWPFSKLAGLLGKIVNIRNQANIPTTDEFRRLTHLHDLHNSEVAADYYIPLFFVRVGIFEVSQELGDRLQKRQLIERNSRMEFEYRAATMAAGRALAELTGYPISAVDEELWRTGYLRCRLCRPGVSDEELPCAYRELSIGYQGDDRLMEMRWPLVLTTCY